MKVGFSSNNVTFIKCNGIEIVFPPIGKCLWYPQPVILEGCPTATPTDFSGILSWNNAEINISRIRPDVWGQGVLGGE